MPGTRRGGLKAYRTALKNYGEEYLRQRAAKGGSVKVAKGFAKIDKEKLREISSKGGSAPRRKVDSTKLRPRRPRVSDARWYV